MRVANHLVALVIFCLMAPSYADRPRPCVFVVFGGNLHRNPNKPSNSSAQDMASVIQHDVAGQARRSRCRVLEIHETQSIDQLTAQLTALRPADGSPVPSYHLAFTDHGADPRLKDEDSYYIASGTQVLKLTDLFSMLSRNIPSGARVTFNSSTCSPRFSEVASHTGFDQRYDFCGSSSTLPHRMSYNHIHRSASRGESFQRQSDQSLTGTYASIAAVTAVDRRLGNRPISVHDLHLLARRGDLGNIQEHPGMTSSLSYIAKETSLINPMDAHAPFSSYEEVVIYLSRIHASVAHSSEVDPGRCRSCTPPLGQGLSDLLGAMLGGSELRAPPQWVENLPPPYRQSAIQAYQDLARNLRPMQDLELPLERRDPRALEVLHDTRTLSEARMVHNFLQEATPEQRQRFNRLRSCETRPVL